MVLFRLIKYQFDLNNFEILIWTKCLFEQILHIDLSKILRFELCVEMVEQQTDETQFNNKFLNNSQFDS